MTTTTPRRPDTDGGTAAPSVPRLFDARRALGYPPFLLMALTVLALLLAMGTARAHSSAWTATATAGSFSQAVDQLALSTYEDFLPFLPAEGTLVVSESWGLGEGDPEVWRQAFSGPLDELSWSIDIRPLTDLIGATPNAAPTCDDDGVCLEEGDGYRIRLELGLERGAIKLFAIDVAHDAALGC